MVAEPVPFPLDDASDSATLHGLRLPRTSLIGRDVESAAIIDLLQMDDVALVTLTGTGGTGKTRLALQVAATMSARFRDGAVFVALASVTEPEQVLMTIAQALDIRENAQRATLDALILHLQERRLLLVIDNFEQVLDAAPLIAVLVTKCPRLKVIVTSRAPLSIAGEQEYPLSPLALPATDRTVSAADVATFPALLLFVQRARAVRPDFEVNDTTAPVIAAICRKLDGLPLAIELAATRVRMFSPRELLGRLDARLSLLTGGPRDLPERHQTLRRTIEWSYNLLDAPARRVFRQLAAFAGGWTLDAAEAVCGMGDGPPPDVFAGIATLVQQNLVVPRIRDDESRFIMLETIRAYATELLDASPEAEQTRQRHADYYLALAERAYPLLRGSDEGLWLARLEDEHDNCRAALAWLIACGNAAMAQRMSFALSRFWNIRCYNDEGRRWLESALALPEEAPTVSRGNTLYVLTDLLLILGEYAAALAVNEEGARIARAVGDRKLTARFLRNLGELARRRADFKAAQRYHEESLAIRRLLGDADDIAQSLNNLARTLYPRGMYDEAYALLAEGLVLYRQLHHREGEAMAFYHFGIIAYRTGALAEARRHLEASLAIARALDLRLGMPNILVHLSLIAWHEGDLDTATAFCEEGLSIRREFPAQDGFTDTLHAYGLIMRARGATADSRAAFLEGLAVAHALGDKERVAAFFERFAEHAARRGDVPRAARLWGAADRIRREIGAPIPPVEQADHANALTAARSHCAPRDWTRAWNEGERQIVEHTVAFANEWTEDSPTAVVPRIVSDDGRADTETESEKARLGALSARETEVLGLLVTGMTNQGIAERLFLSTRTVEQHLRSIYGKLDVANRTAAARWAAAHGLV